MKETHTLYFSLRVISLLGGSLKKETDEALFLEFALRGYYLSKLWDENDTPAEVEIVKIE